LPSSVQPINVGQDAEDFRRAGRSPMVRWDYGNPEFPAVSRAVNGRRRREID
jgi:hypothetical protein